MNLWSGGGTFSRTHPHIFFEIPPTHDRSLVRGVNQSPAQAPTQPKPAHNSAGLVTHPSGWRKWWRLQARFVFSNLFMGGIYSNASQKTAGVYQLVIFISDHPCDLLLRSVSVAQNDFIKGSHLPLPPGWRINGSSVDNIKLSSGLKERRQHRSKPGKCNAKAFFRGPYSNHEPVFFFERFTCRFYGPRNKRFFFRLLKMMLQWLWNLHRENL